MVKQATEPDDAYDRAPGLPGDRRALEGWLCQRVKAHVERDERVSVRIAIVFERGDDVLQPIASTRLAGTGTPALELHVDQSRTPSALPDYMRGHCQDGAATCALWFDGYFGAPSDLLASGPAAVAERDPCTGAIWTFHAVRFVRKATAEDVASGGILVRRSAAAGVP